MSSVHHPIIRLQQTIEALLAPNGCPWDQKQSTHSLRKYFIDELAEIVTAIDNDDPENLCEELGDMLFLLLLTASINDKQGLFSLHDVIHTINDKMIRRHPHVFAGGPTGTVEELEQQWREIKAMEKAKKSRR